MFWAKKVFSYADSVAEDMHDIAAAQGWYKEKINCTRSSAEVGEEVGGIVVGSSA